MHRARSVRRSSVKAGSRWSIEQPNHSQHYTAILNELYLTFEDIGWIVIKAYYKSAHNLHSIALYRFDSFN